MTDSWPGPGALDTGTSDLLAAVDNGVATIALNRPARRNALSDEMLAALARLLRRLDGADDVAALVITGSGPAFCAGGDVKEFAERGGEGGTATEADPAGIAEQQRIQRATTGALHAFPRPVIAALPGAVAGAGLGFALAADLRIGTPGTVMTTAFAKVGLSGDYGTAWLLRDLVGPARAAELMFLSDRVDADAALRLGLLNWVVAPGELGPRAAGLAARLAAARARRWPG